MLLDLEQADSGPEGVVQVLPNKDAPIETTTNFLPIRDFSAPRYKEPWPLHDATDPRGSGKYFLAACKLHAATPYAIYLVDTFGNLTLVRAEPDYDLTEPIPLRPRFAPPTIPDRIDLTKDTATVHLVDVYEGPGLKGVPKGSVKQLRVYAYHFGYEGIGGHIPVAINGPWDARRILGTVPVEEDGSAFFEVPANVPIAVQPLDDEGAALQIMRSWLPPRLASAPRVLAATNRPRKRPHLPAAPWRCEREHARLSPGTARHGPSASSVRFSRYWINTVSAATMPKAQPPTPSPSTCAARMMATSTR